MIYIDWNILKGSKPFRKLHADLKQAFLKIRVEFDDHLQAINENTNEINANYEFLLNLDMKIDKLNEKMDEIMLFLSCDEPAEKKHPSLRLTAREQEVFMVLYARDGDLIGYKDLAKLLCLSTELVERYINNLIKKGIPIIKRYADNQMYLILDADFRNLQAKENLVGLNETVSRDLQQRKII